MQSKQFQRVLLDKKSMNMNRNISNPIGAAPAVNQMKENNRKSRYHSSKLRVFGNKESAKLDGSQKAVNYPLHADFDKGLKKKNTRPFKKSSSLLVKSNFAS